MKNRIKHYFYAGTNQYETASKTRKIKVDMNLHPALSVGDVIEINELHLDHEKKPRKHMRIIKSIQLPLFSSVQEALLSLSTIKKIKQLTSPPAR